VPTPESQFVDLVRTWLVSLPHDLKIAFEAMDDENLSRADRELAVGTIVYIVSPRDSATDRSEAVVSFADDTMLLRLALRRFARKKDDEDTQAFVERFPELFDNLDRDLDLCARMMGDLFNWLEAKVDGLRSLAYKGKKVQLFLDNDEAREDLFEIGLAFRTDYPIDERTVGDKLKKSTTVLDVMRRRQAEEATRAASV
jgi:uncharacterized membrane protein YkvA (DUF1232 family)